MELLLDVLRLLVSILIAFLAGNLIAKGKLPSILGWLIAGMLLGPYALGLDVYKRQSLSRHRIIRRMCGLSRR